MASRVLRRDIVGAGAGAPYTARGMGPRATLHFLGWTAEPLAQAAEALVDTLGDDLGGTLVAVPGARVGRGLAGALRRAATRRGRRGWTPPRIVTQGRLVDELLPHEAPVADRATRTFAWERALAQVLADGHAPLFERVPEPADRLGWWRLAERVRTLHGELADAGHDFADVLSFEPGGGAGNERERQRWEALARVQRRWRALLAEVGLADPHDARNLALREGRVAQGHRVALVGVVDGPGLLRRALAALTTPPDVFVLAPEAERAGFDALGLLTGPDGGVAHWTARAVELPLGRWHVVAGPEEEAEVAARVVARRAAEASPARHAGEVTLGVADESAIPFLERRFAAEGVRARPAAGEALERTPPARLLEAIARWLDGYSAASAAALVRHPDLERVLLARLLADAPTASWAQPGKGAARGEQPAAPALPDLAALLDRVRHAHVLERLDPRELDAGLPSGARPRDAAALAALFAHLGALLGPLAKGAPLPLAAAASAARELLVQVYAGVPLEGLDDAARTRREALAALGEALDVLGAVPPALAGELAPSAALDLVVRALRGRAVPPAPESAGTPTLELLGWLELPFDPAPVLVVTGFVEGGVPSSPSVDPFLPDSLRARLGLEDDAHRTARDAYVLATLLATRSVDVVSPRRTREGDPLFPSRLAFHAPPEEALARVRHALAPVRVTGTRASGAEAGKVARYARPKVTPRTVPSLFSVTDFRVYLESPYRYAVERLLRAEAVDDGARELDAPQFGTLVHDAACVLAAPELAGASDVARLEDGLLASLDRIAEQRHGRAPLAAVAMQIEQARLRLVDLAAWQAERARAGWRVLEVEWQPSARLVDGNPRSAVPLHMPPGEPPAWLTGKIDRIDQNTRNGALAILDYKTGAKPLKPDDVYVRVGRKKDAPREWRDPQLALYCLLASELLGEREELPELGYLSLTPSGLSWDPAPPEWATEGVVASATELACQIVGQVRAGVLDSLGRARHFAPELYAELVGVGYVVAPDGDTDDDDAGEEDEA